MSKIKGLAHLVLEGGPLSGLQMAVIFTALMTLSWCMHMTKESSPVSFSSYKSTYFIIPAPLP